MSLNIVNSFKIAFSPNNIAGLAHWYDAADVNTITKDGSDRVSIWADKKGTENLLQPVSGDQPLFVASGQGGIGNIDCTDNRAMATSGGIPEAQPISIYITLKLPENLAVLQRVIEAETGVDRPSFFEETSDLWVMNAAFSINGPLGGFEGTWTLLRLIYNNTTSSMEMDEQLITSGTTGPEPYQGLNLAGETSGKSNIIVGEILKYSAVLDAEDDSDVINYLKSKWGLSF